MYTVVGPIVCMHQVDGSLRAIFLYVEENTTIKTNKSGLYRAFSLIRPASMLIY